MTCGAMRFGSLVAAVLFSMVLTPLSSFGQNETFDPHPLRPGDTSSPRDTLRSFITDANRVIQDWRTGTTGPPTRAALGRAADTLDLRATPDGGTWFEKENRVILLKEILDRVELPDFADIPGEAEVEAEAVTTWSLPSTRITIARNPSGPNAGKFQFTAETVQRLGEYYRRSQHLPYKPDATIGAYEDFVQSGITLYGQSALVRNRLKPVDTSSPRSTFQGFLHAVNRAYAMVAEAEAALDAIPPTLTIEQAREIETNAASLLRRARGTLDLSDVPSALRTDVGTVATLQLKEILDRLALPPVGSIPVAQSPAVEQSDDGATASQSVVDSRWRIPGTDIELVQILEGERQGEFLFSARTVRRLGPLYERLRDLPYRSDEIGELATGYVSPEKSEGFYESYVSTPGYLIPRTSLIGRLIHRLPLVLKSQLGSLIVWQWLGLLLCSLALLVVAYIALRVGRAVVLWAAAPFDRWLTIVPPLIVALFVYVVADFIDNDLNLTGASLTATTAVGEVILLTIAGWAIFMVFTALAETIIALSAMPSQGMNASLMRICARIVGLLLAAWLVIARAQNLGADLVPLVAGLGVGGLAVALAAQATLANFIGGLILYAVKPVRVGDFCRYGTDMGTVEEIGWQTTSIRTLERTVVSVPNAEFSKMKLDNFAARDRRLMHTTLRLRYETTPEQLRFVLARLRELLLGHPMVSPEPARVRLIGYSEYSKDVEIFAYLLCTDHNVFLAAREDLLLRIEDIIREAGSGFAIPAQIEYQAPDVGIDAERGALAETRVQEWRTRGKLPFPEFEEEERERLQNTLDYPPKGSPDHEANAGSPVANPTAGRAPRTKSIWSRGLLKRRGP